MARITEMPKGIEPVWIHDVTHPVGLNWFGYKDGVKLLQYGLNKVMAKVPFPDLSAHARLALSSEGRPSQLLEVVPGSHPTAACRARSGYALSDHFKSDQVPCVRPLPTRNPLWELRQWTKVCIARHRAPKHAAYWHWLKRWCSSATWLMMASVGHCTRQAMQPSHRSG
jgi:hypothetical protein